MRFSTPAPRPMTPRPMTSSKRPRGGEVIVTALCLTFALALAASCNKKTESGAASGTAPAAAGTYRFAFVTNNSSDFWNIAEKGLRKAEKDFGVKVDMFRPLKGEIADQ